MNTPTAERARPDLHELTAEQLQPLEVLMVDGWPDTWREFARSHYLTLMALQPDAALPVIAAQAVELARGIAQDMGGSQPYIPVGHFFAAGARAMRVIQLLGQRMSYREVAEATGLTESSVRKIEAAWRRDQVAQRQGQLPL